MSLPDEYVPGVCNIGRAEIRARRVMAWAAVGVTLVLWLGLAWLNVARPWRLAVFLPALVAALGHLQAARRFCVAFGWLGLMNFATPGRADNVAEAEFRRQDRRTAMRTFIVATLIAAAVAAVACFIP